MRPDRMNAWERDWDGSEVIFHHEGTKGREDTRRGQAFVWDLSGPAAALRAVGER